MEISEIKKIGKGLRYSLKVDDKFVGVFESEILARYNLKSGQEIDEKFLASLQKENGDYACFDRALNLLEHGSKTQKQVEDYLKGKGYPQECITKAMQKLEDYGYLDDQAYTNEYVRLYGQKDGEKKIRFSLKAKGVSDEKISLALEKYLDQETQFDTCFRLAEKKVKNMELDGKGRQKLFVYLAGRGFSLDIIKSAVNKLESKR